MAIVITDIGKQKALEYLVGKDSSTESLIIKLFSSNTTPDKADTLSLYTEVSGGGYASQTLDASLWSISAGVATYPQLTWTFTSSVGTVYGYYLISSTSNYLMAAERFANAPYTISNNGDTISLTLNINLS